MGFITGIPFRSESSTSYKYLDPSQRPELLEIEVDAAFKKICGDHKSSWTVFNGRDEYSLCNVKEHLFTKQMILAAYPKQKEFYVLEIGAGNFQFEVALARYLNEQTDLPFDVKIHIIGVRGEKNVEREVVETGRCKIYKLGAFKAEEIIEAFHERGLYLENKIDLTISSWCFRHLADPVGTFVQTYNLLRPQTGTLIMDGFFFLYEGEELENIKHNERMTQLFSYTLAPFLTYHHSQNRSLNHFMLRRPNHQPCRLPMAYVTTIDPGSDWQINARVATVFKRTRGCRSKEFDVPKRDFQMSGDKKMYEWLKQSRLLLSPQTLWKPLVAKDRFQKVPFLHRAIIRQDPESISRCLGRGCDINESNHSGETPLHLAVRQKNMALCRRLLKRGVDLGLVDGQGYSALHTAVSCDKRGTFVEMLIQEGADLNLKEQSHSPMDIAIKQGNQKAVRLLLQAGAEVSIFNYEKLQGEAFASLHSLLPEPPEISTAV